jgi:hypothetical protein
VAGVRENGQMVERIAVTLPCPATSAESSTTDPSASGPRGAEPSLQDASVLTPAASAAADAVYTVERLSVHPGMSIKRGDELCRLADHRWLYIRGEAFEQDVASIAQLNRRGWSVTAEFGHQHDKAHEPVERVEGLHVVYVDNHVDPISRTFRFYLRLPNEVAHEYADLSEVAFQEWRFKPGQLAHLIVPVQEWEQQIKLPLAAIVDEGLNVFVFRSHQEHVQADGEIVPNSEPGLHSEPFAEFEPVAVHVLHRDERHAIVAADGSLKPGDVVALNRAYELRLEMKRQAGEGGHDHHHDH